MQPITGLLTYFQQRLGPAGLLLVSILAVAASIAAFIAVSMAMDAFAAAADPVQVAPLRWGNRHV